MKEGEKDKVNHHGLLIKHDQLEILGWMRGSGFIKPDCICVETQSQRERRERELGGDT